MRLGAPWLFLMIASSSVLTAAANPLTESRQCVVATSPDWNSPTGEMRAFERPRGGDWKPVGGTVPVVLGKRGLAWGIGLVPAPKTGPQKVEGDNKATAGIFALGPAFGYASADRASWIKLRYVPLTKETEGVDDPHSRYYNQLVDRSKVALVDWKTSEKMLRADVLYKWGLFVAHNPDAKPRAGSCIFFHIWRNASSATAGCTAMPEKNLVELLRWLDPAARPVLIQMPRNEYNSLRGKFGLPSEP